MIKNMSIGQESRLGLMLKEKGLSAKTELDLDSRINVLIGGNGAGKTTFLNYLKESWMPEGESEDAEDAGLILYDEEPSDEAIRESIDELEIPISKIEIHSGGLTGMGHLFKGHMPGEGIILNRGAYKRLVHNNAWAVLYVYHGGFTMRTSKTFGYKNNANMMVAISADREPEKLYMEFPMDDEKLFLIAMDIIKGKFNDPIYRKKLFEEHSKGEIQINILKMVSDFYKKRKKGIPSVVLLDDFAAGLSPEHQRKASEYVIKLSNSRAEPQTFLATHSHLVLAGLPDDAIITDLNVDLNDGKIAQYRRADLKPADIYRITGNEI